MELDNPKTIMKLDKEDMLGLLAAFPEQCKDAVSIGERARGQNSYRKSYSQIVFTGLGGSAIGADIVKGYIGDQIKMPILVNRNYLLPECVGRNSLVFAVSYSGNTEETLSAYSDARARKAKIIVITSGGKLAKLALKNKDMLIKIPGGYPPRCALGYSFIPAIMALAKLGLTKNRKTEIQNATRTLKSLYVKELSPAVKANRNIAKKIAKALYKRFAVIYASSAMESVAIRWRGQLAENSKALSSHHVFPEMNHNEIVGWVHPRNVLNNFVTIMLKDKNDHPRIRRRMDITSSILRKECFSVIDVKGRGKGFLDRMLSMVYIGDFVSFYLSILNNIDPTPVDRVTYLKKQLAKG